MIAPLFPPSLSLGFTLCCHWTLPLWLLCVCITMTAKSLTMDQDPQYEASLNIEPLFALKLSLGWWHMKFPPSSSIPYSVSHLYGLELKLNTVKISSELFSKPMLFFYCFSVLIRVLSNTQSFGSMVMDFDLGGSFWGILVLPTLALYSNIFLFQHLQNVSWTEKLSLGCFSPAS